MAGLEPYPADDVTPPIPRPSTNSSADGGGGASPPSSTSSSSEAENEEPRKSRYDRPRLTTRQKSNSIIVPKGKAVIQTDVEYPPDDARAMSPRRNSEDVEKLGQEARQSLKE
jgi:short coiled-coil protein